MAKHHRRETFGAKFQENLNVPRRTMNGSNLPTRTTRRQCSSWNNRRRMGRQWKTLLQVAHYVAFAFACN